MNTVTGLNAYRDAARATRDAYRDADLDAERAYLAYIAARDAEVVS